MTKKPQVFLFPWHLPISIASSQCAAYYAHCGFIAEQPLARFSLASESTCLHSRQCGKVDCLAALVTGQPDTPCLGLCRRFRRSARCALFFLVVFPSKCLPPNPTGW